jgi:2-haloacid dehalogenase
VGTIDAVVFDLGGVLLDWDPRHLYRELFGGDDDAVERFLDDLDLMAWHYENHDTGRRPMSETIAEKVADHPEHADALWAWRDRYADMSGAAIDGTIELMRELRPLVRLFMLSNAPIEGMAELRARWEFFGWFDGQVISAEERLVKPDPRLFELVMARFDLVPDSTVFVDDRPVNVEAARRLGLHGIVFDTAAALRRELIRLGLALGS